MEKNSENSDETYKLWSGSIPPKEVELINSKYWESAHFTKEYIMFLELKATKIWRDEFIKQNDLVQDTVTPSIPSEALSWFTPPKNYKIFIPSGFNQGSTYYFDTSSGHMFIYEIQL